ncbi:MAG TPA: sulfite reductase subunit alpha [Devosia sp.]|nr:sulfite reductase subunit alpha [Devosia sp.]
MSIAFTPQIVAPTAPFNDRQRAWLNRLLAEALLRDLPAEARAAKPAAPVEDDSTPWKDPAMAIEDRMALATSRPVRFRLMAAMAQQDCGQCGYNCADYSKAIFEQAEPRLNLCAPGGKATARMLKSLVEEMGGGAIGPDEIAAKAAAAPREPADGRRGYSREHPVKAKFLSRARLNGTGSEKHTCHIEIDLSDSGLEYQVGDSLGVFPANDPALADAIIAAIDVPPDFPIAGEPLRQVLIERTSLGAAPDALFQFISYLTGGERRKKARALSRGEDPDGDAAHLDVLAALEKFVGVRPDPEALIEVLEPLQPRLYSISSSPKTNPGRVALTVDSVRYEALGRERHGVASTWLGGRLGETGEMLVYVQKAHNFSLPADGATPIIMVGPGTGVAPFRAFLHERMATGATGPAWLFFGHQREAHDYFYADEWAMLQAKGVLTNLSLAWSRDGAQKTYVQQRIREAGAELWSWLERGAHFYVCGDAQRMAKDVEQAVCDVAKAHGGFDTISAMELVVQLKSQGRYMADVY